MAERPRRGGHPLLELTRARLLEFVREPAAIFWVFVFPVLLAIGLGIAFREQGPDRFRVALVDPSPAARAVAAGLADAPDLDVLERTDAAATADLRAGRVDLAFRAAPPGDGAAAPWALTYRFDPTNPRARAARAALDDALQRALGRADVATVSEAPFREPGGRYIDFLIPGLLGLNLMGTSMWGVGYAIAQSRRKRLLRRFAVTPMRRSHFLLSYLYARLVFMVFEVTALLLFAWLAFDVTLRGGLLDLAALALLGAWCFSGLAALVASRTASVEVASGLMNAVQMPMWILSGVFFSYERFPEEIHGLIRALPLTALNDALRAVVNEGAGLGSQLPEVAVLAVWGALAFPLALRLFRWQ